VWRVIIEAMTEKLTPMMTQYKAVKEQYKDCMVFFRLGDFYEMFFEDAMEGSKILGITLTSRTKGEGAKVPMCGVPFHAVDNYIGKLTRAGKKVAICDQVTEPNGHGIVERDVVKVITPGTTFDDNILDGKANNYVACLVRGYDGFGFAYSDVTTGAFFVSEFVNFDGILNELTRVGAAELIVPESLSEDVRVRDLRKSGIDVAVFTYETAKDPRSVFTDNFGIKSIQVFGLDSHEAALIAAANLYEYLRETQKTELSHIEKIAWYSVSEFMPLYKSTVRNLEIFHTAGEGKREGSLASVVDKTVTAMGGRKMRNWMMHPLKSEDEIGQRFDAVSEFLGSSAALKDVRGILGGSLDIERILSRLSLGTGNARDLVALKESMKIVPEVKVLLKNFGSEFVSGIAGDLVDLKELVSLVETAIDENPPAIIREGGMMADGYNSELDDLRSVRTEGKTFIAEMQQREIERTGISSLKIKYNKVFGYYIEISKANLDGVPEDYIRKQTLVNAERFITPELKEYEEKVLNSVERICELEYRLFNEVREKVVAMGGDIRRVADAVARLDVVCSFAELALVGNYCRPEIVPENVIEIADGRHPIVESLRFGRDFVPNDCRVGGVEGDGAGFLNLITGPNMGGKSVYIKQVALIVYLAHIGCFVPARECRLGLVDQIFTRVGAHDNLGDGESTFMVEMMEAASILHNATERSLIILDEIGRGTSTYDGVSIAWAICEYIHDSLKSKTLFATHYHELVSLVDELDGGKNFSVAVSDSGAGKDDLVFLYKVVKGGTSKSYGIEVAKLAGLPKSVIMRARGVLGKLEEDVVGLRETPAPDDQIAMFDERGHKALEELKDIDADRMTPIEALNKFHELKEKGLL
jgi:DNA mismatch repair protein MutS